MLLWSSDSFAYADSYDEAAGRYRGLRCGPGAVAGVDVQSGLVVRPDAAVKQQKAEAPVTGGGGVGVPAGGTETVVTPTGGPTPGAGAASDGTRPQPSTAPKRYHGTVSLDPTRAGRDAGRIAEEVIAHLAGLPGAQVTVTLEIEAEIPAGAPDHVVRAVTENSRTLRFASHGFEVE
jgi:hypothetical protein